MHACMEVGHKTHLAKRTERIHHLRLHGAQGRGCVHGDVRIARREIVPADLGQGVREGRVERRLESRCAGARCERRVPRW